MSRPATPADRDRPWPVEPLRTARGQTENVTVPVHVLKDALMFWLQTDDIAVIRRAVGVITEVGGRLAGRDREPMAGMIAQVVMHSYEATDEQYRLWNRALSKLMQP